MSEEEKQFYMDYCKYDKEPKEVILQLIDIIENQQKEIKELENSNLEQRRYIQGLTIATGIALHGRTVEVSKKALYELENTMKIEQIYIPENDSYRFRAR